uniref:HIRAN domain-containing protein n=1 Tax=Amphimedon queenslandica TaxID=400682 RepID=A0A1X7TX07_AMPQE
MFSFVYDSVIRGHHIYKEIWIPLLGEILSCEVEPGNIFDPYAVAIKRSCIYGDNATVGHVPRKISAVCCMFLRRGTINCNVTGARKHSTDLVQGGLEVPCTLTFTGMKQDIEKVKNLLECAPSVDYPLPVPAIKRSTSHISNF